MAQGASRTMPVTVPDDARLHRRARRRTRRGIGVPRGLIHLLVLGVIIAVVSGRGAWGVSGAPALMAGVDQVGDLRQFAAPGATGMPSAEALTASTAVTIAAPGSDFRTGYVSELASAVVPGQLKLQTITTTGETTIADIAQQTGRSINTILWANGMSDPAKPLPEGTQVRVPPVNGMLHIVQDGDTLESIAARYDVEVEAITGYAGNNVETSADLVPYRMLMVPGGQMPTRDRVIIYTVREGDSLASISQYFGLSPSTIVWANSLPDGNLIFPGQHLAILPIDGVMVTVEEGDTVESLAEHFGVDPSAIRDHAQNGLGAGGQLRVGQQVMIPGGQPPAPPPPPPAPAPAAPPASADPAPAPAPAAPAAPSGRFIWPAAGTITQYFGPSDFWMEPAYGGYPHFHLGLDIANGLGTPILAADSGTVIFAGWNTAGLGYAVAIDHGNGFVTWYGHMNAQPAVWVGQYVEQGQYIGPMGTTGMSTGSHLHFVVIKNGVYVDPLDYLR